MSTKTQANRHRNCASRYLTVIWLVSGLMVLAGCTVDRPPPSGETTAFTLDEFRNHIASNVENVASNAHDGLASYRVASTFHWYARHFDVVHTLCDSELADSWKDFNVPWSSNWGSYEGSCGYEDRSRLNLHRLAQDFVEELVPLVFSEANLVEASGGALSFELVPENMCERYSCRRWFANAGVQLHVRSPAREDYAIEAAFGLSEVSSLIFTIYRDHLGVSVDLGQLKATIEDLEPSWELPFIDGATELRLEGTRGRPSLVMDVLEPLAIRIGDVDAQIGVGAESLRWTMVGEEVHVLMNFRNVDVQFTDDASRAQARIPHLSAELIFRNEPSELEINRLTFGSSAAELYFDGELEAAIVLNPEEGEQFRSTINWQTGEVRVATTFDVFLDMKFQRLRRLGVDLSDWMRRDEVRVRFEDAREAFLTRGRDFVQVHQGELRLESRILREPILVGPDQCLVGGGAAEHPFEGFRVESCNP